jgi:antitoxin FitA
VRTTGHICFGKIACMSGAQVLDMSGAGVNVQNMSKMIQIRNVPDQMHRELKLRAAAAGMSLSDYIKRELGETAPRRADLEEIDAEIRAQGPSRVKTKNVVEFLRETRGD